MADYKTVAAPPAAPGQTAQPTPKERLSDDYAQGVWIPVLQNFGGGVGLMLLIAVPLWRLFGMAAALAFEVGGILGAMLFGLAMVVRAFDDELFALLAAHGERQDKATRLALEQEVATLREQIARMSADDEVKTNVLAFIAARRLIAEAYNGKRISRDEVVKRGVMSREAWETANAKLKTAGIVNGRSELLLTTEGEALGALMRFMDDSRGMGTWVTAPGGELVRVK